MAGMLLFGSSKALRSNYPMLRLDYIRVPGNTWINNPNDRFTTIDMRGSLILLLYRAIDAVNADLSKGFLLDGNSLQTSAVGLPINALREAIVNALMHRSYREHRPTQIIRYDNRIEIINPGFSLKSEEKLGEPGSETRNPFIASVFHDTNLAETKGSGIRAMRRLMEAAHLTPPTFESRRDSNEFTSRLLLHHFLNEEDLVLLKQFDEMNLSDAQKQALIFVREVGAIDNQTYRQMADCDTLKASNELRVLRNNKLLIAKGKARATYYIASEIINNGSAPAQELSAPPQKLSAPPQELSAPPQKLSAPPQELSTPPQKLSTPPQELSTPPQELSTPPQELSTQPQELSTQPQELSTQPQELSTQPQKLSTQPQELSTQPQELCAPPRTLEEDIIIGAELKAQIESLGIKETNPEKFKIIILELCKLKALKTSDIARFLNRSEKYIKENI